MKNVSIYVILIKYVVYMYMLLCESQQNSLKNISEENFLEHPEFQSFRRHAWV